MGRAALKIMTLDAAFQAGHAAIISAHGGISVQIGTVTGTGLLVLSDGQTDFSIEGQMGTTISTVRVSAATFRAPTRGDPMKVDGQQVYVLGVRTSGGIHVIATQDTQPVEGV